MGRVHDSIDHRLAGWLERQPVFFVATAPLDPNGHVNCSPKGNRGELAILAPDQVAYLDETGSGIETVAHVRDNGRIVLMFCSFEGPPRIVRVHGRARVVTAGDPAFPDIGASFARLTMTGVGSIGARSIIVTDVDRVSDSCGYAVPLMDFRSHRTTLDDWAERKGAEGIRGYWQEKNLSSIDGLAGLPLLGGSREPE
jgi:hypothetical protein